jgi:hypothetical protein
MSVDDPRTVAADDDHDAYEQHLVDRMRDHEPVSLHVARAALAAYDNPTSPQRRAALLRAIRDDLRTGRPLNAVDPSSVAAFPDAVGPSQDPSNQHASPGGSMTHADDAGDYKVTHIPDMVYRRGGWYVTHNGQVLTVCDSEPEAVAYVETHRQLEHVDTAALERIERFARERNDAA